MTDYTAADPAPSSDMQAQPHNREAEEAVLGSVLIDPETYFDVAQILQPEDFYIVRNRWIWEACVRLHEQRMPIDYVTLTTELEQHEQLTEIGGQAYLTHLFSLTPSSMHAQSYATLVRDNSIRRNMLTSANSMAKMAFDRAQPIDTILDNAEQSVFSISERRARKDIQPINTVMSDVYDHIDLLSQRGSEIMGVPTGLYDVDKILGGLQKSDLLIVAGRPGMGKTGFLLSVAKNAALTYKKHVAMFSMEMSNEQLALRLIAQETGIDTQRLRTGKLQENEWAKFTHAIEVLSDTTIFLDDTPAITPLQLRTKCRRLHMEYNLDLVLVDYLQLMGGDTRTDNRVQEVSYISRNLKVLARELNVPVMAAAQLSRAVEQRTDKRPVLSDLRESGSLEQDADIVLFIHRPNMMEKEQPGMKKPDFEQIELIVAKHRNGPTSPGIGILFQGNVTRFENAADEAGQPLKKSR
jgi:replicative DNA helicase